MKNNNKNKLINSKKNYEKIQIKKLKLIIKLILKVKHMPRDIKI